MQHNLKYDLIIKNVNVVQAQKNVTESVDIAIKDAKIAALEFNLCAEDAFEIHDGKGQTAFPGVVDSHL